MPATRAMRGTRAMRVTRVPTACQQSGRSCRLRARCQKQPPVSTRCAAACAGRTSQDTAQSPCFAPPSLPAPFHPRAHVADFAPPHHLAAPCTTGASVLRNPRLQVLRSPWPQAPSSRRPALLTPLPLAPPTGCRRLSAPPPRCRRPLAPMACSRLAPAPPPPRRLRRPPRRPTRWRRSLAPQPLVRLTPLSCTCWMYPVCVTATLFNC